MIFGKKLSLLGLILTLLDFLRLMNVAVLITVFNRKKKTLMCLHSLQETLLSLPDHEGRYSIKVFLTDDGCTDGTSQAILEEGFSIPIEILQGTGSLFWNGGMINSWKAALADKVDYDGYLWLNDDTVVLESFWEDLDKVDSYCFEKYGVRGIYCGSTKDSQTGDFTYGGFNYVRKLSLLDQFVVPDGKNIYECEACHGNITYVSSEVVEHEGIFCEKYIHGGTDHDYSYLAHKHGFPVLIMPDYCGECENDHIKKQESRKKLNLKERIAASKKPTAHNMHNVILFNKRCFPWRVPFVYFTEWAKVLFPDFSKKIYLTLRKR